MPDGAMYMMVKNLLNNTLLIHSKLSGLNCSRRFKKHFSVFLQVHIDLSSYPEFNSEVEFVRKLLMEESVFCLPGEVSWKI